MSDTNDFYDIKISQDIISEKEKNIITDSLMKNEETINKQSDIKHWYNNKCFFFSALVLSSMVISTGIYMCFTYL
jgi:hypothetical protein